MTEIDAIRGYRGKHGKAIVNALVAAETMTGHRGRRLEAIDREWLSSLFAESRPDLP